MIFNNFFKTAKHKQFEYSPRYYDQQKEELEQRIKAIKGEQNSEGEITKYRLENFFQKRRSSSFAQKQKRQSNLRLVLIIIILGILVYFFLR